MGPLHQAEGGGSRMPGLRHTGFPPGQHDASEHHCGNHGRQGDSTGYWHRLQLRHVSIEHNLTQTQCSEHLPAQERQLKRLAFYRARIGYILFQGAILAVKELLFLSVAQALHMHY